jgi:hypothetical protein
LLIEAKMTLPKYTAEDLKQLPLRAIVALAARCARRVEKLALLPDDHPGALDCRSTVKQALEMAEDFARGVPCAPGEGLIRQLQECQQAAEGDEVRQDALASIIQTAGAAATARNVADIRSEPAESHPLGPGPEPGPLSNLANVTADVAALCAFTAAVDAADAVGYSDAFIQAAVRDYRRALDLRLGNYPESGQPIDPGPDGPLGPLQPI